MNHPRRKSNNTIEHFALIGTNFTKADTRIRSRYAVTKAGEIEAYQKAIQFGFQDFFLVSTCNRTEFYACAPVVVLKQLVAAQFKFPESEFKQYFYILTGIEAVRHFLRVVSGLDSQIIGDYEIVCQVKSSLDEARKHNLAGTITDRIANFAYQAQKKIKADTNLSSGKYSVSYAAACLVHHQSRMEKFRNILLVGAGDFGTAVVRNLRQYFPSVSLTITNRTRDKAEKAAARVNARVIAFEDLKQHLKENDVIITTVGLEYYLILAEDVKGLDKKLFVDLSVPQSVDPAVKDLEGIRLFSVDEVSSFHNQLLQQRQLEVPRAENIINLYLTQLMEWQHVYNHRHIVLSYKEKVRRLTHGFQFSAVEGAIIDQDRKVDKAFSELIRQIREQGYAGCRMIETLSNLVPIFER